MFNERAGEIERDCERGLIQFVRLCSGAKIECISTRNKYVSIDNVETCCILSKEEYERAIF